MSAVSGPSLIISLTPPHTLSKKGKYPPGYGHVLFPLKLGITDSAIARFRQVKKGSISISVNLPVMVKLL